MRIVHDSTVKISRGWQTIITILNDDGSNEALVISHSAKTSKIKVSDIDLIEAAMDREKIIDRREVISKEISSEIEDSLINWLSVNKGIELRFLRWTNNVMLGFSNASEAEAHDAENENNAEESSVRKKRIMLG